MPVVLAVPLFQAVTWLCTALGLGAFLGFNPVDKISDFIREWVVSYAAAKAGLKLDDVDPLSDSSFAMAISERVGFTVRTLKDKKTLEVDVMAGAAQLIAAKSGVLLTDVSDAEKIRADVMAYGVGRLATDAGIYLSNPLDIESVKADLKLWGKQQAMSEVAEDLASELNLKDSDGVRLRELIAARGFAGVKPVDLLKNANVLLVGYAREEFARAESITKKTARRLQLREAQSKFRRAHGNRQKYVPLGMTAVIG